MDILLPGSQKAKQIIGFFNLTKLKREVLILAG